MAKYFRVVARCICFSDLGTGSRRRPASGIRSPPFAHGKQLLEDLTTTPARVHVMNVVVVGATGTIGQATVRALADDGAQVLAVGRSNAPLHSLAAKNVSLLSCDLGSRSSAVDIASSARALWPRVDGLVVAAGRHGPIGPVRDLTRTGLSDYLDEHLVSVVSLIGELATALDAAEQPSIVLFSGGGATGPRPRYTPYALAKVALVRLVENIALEEPGWRVNAVAPGFVASGIHESSLAAGQERSGEDPDELRRRLLAAEGPERAVALVRFLLGPESAGISGRLISAAWDPWEDPSWRDVLKQSESLGRIRRIDGVQFGEIH